MADHPGIVFRDGPAGPRPGLVGGPDVWEIVGVFQGMDAQYEDALRQTTEVSGLRLEQVQSALWYYADYPDEIDAWIRRVDAEAHRAEAAWRRQQAQPGR